MSSFCFPLLLNSFIHSVGRCNKHTHTLTTLLIDPPPLGVDGDVEIVERSISCIVDEPRSEACGEQTMMIALGSKSRLMDSDTAAPIYRTLVCVFF